VSYETEPTQLHEEIYMSDVTYVGTVSALVEKKAGWHTVEISVPGKQYPVKADTKLEPLLKAVREIRDNDLVATFTVSETESENINPKSGKPFIERRLEKVEASTQNAQNANASPTTASEGMSKEDWARKDSAIHMMAAIKAAADALKHTIPSDPTAADLNTFLESCKTLSYNWWQRAEAVRSGEDTDAPFLSEADDDIPY
jgi:hypothetical protein